jgi:hypothetical protein
MQPKELEQGFRRNTRNNRNTEVALPTFSKSVTSLNRVFLEQLIVLELTNEFPAPLEPAGMWPRSLKPACCPHQMPYKSSSQHLALLPYYSRCRCSHIYGRVFKSFYQFFLTRLLHIYPSYMCQDLPVSFFWFVSSNNTFMEEYDFSNT